MFSLDKLVQAIFHIIFLVLILSFEFEDESVLNTEQVDHNLLVLVISYAPFHLCCLFRTQPVNLCGKLAR